jgi:hypothetical protein
MFALALSRTLTAEVRSWGQLCRPGAPQTPRLDPPISKAAATAATPGSIVMSFILGSSPSFPILSPTGGGT